MIFFIVTKLWIHSNSPKKKKKTPRREAEKHSQSSSDRFPNLWWWSWEQKMRKDTHPEV